MSSRHCRRSRGVTASICAIWSAPGTSSSPMLRSRKSSGDVTGSGSPLIAAGYHWRRPVAELRRPLLPSSRTITRLHHHLPTDRRFDPDRSVGLPPKALASARCRNDLQEGRAVSLDQLGTEARNREQLLLVRRPLFDQREERLVGEDAESRDSSLPRLSQAPRSERLGEAVAASGGWKRSSGASPCRFRLGRDG